MKIASETVFSIALTGLFLFNSCGVGIGEGEGEENMKKLPPARKQGTVAVEKAIAERRSVRSFTDSPLSMEEVSQLLWAAQGITEPGRGLRAVPSAGATYPLETYLITSDGVFSYLPDTHVLRKVKEGDVRQSLSKAALGQECVRQAPATFVFAALQARTTGRYGERGIMYIHMEAGHAAQNIHLQAVALGLGSVPVGAFDEKAAAVALGVPEGQVILYMVPVGRSK